MLRLAALVGILAHTSDAAAVIMLSASDARSWHDFDVDGSFDDGASSDDATQLGPLRNETHAARGGISFLLPDFPIDESIDSATLTLHFSSAVHDTTQNADPNPPYLFPPPLTELHGFTNANGQVSRLSVETDNLLSAFFPQPNAASSFDVTDFIKDLVLSNQKYAGFSGRVANDDQATTRSHAWFWSRNAPDGLTPTLEISAAVVPEPASLVVWLALFSTVIAGAILQRRRLSPDDHG
jgi:hypothetical protein